MKKKLQGGSSLIEIIIATAVVGGVLTAVAMALTFSIKSTAEANYRSVATNKAQEAMEVFRREKTLLGWDNFYSVNSGFGTICLNTLPGVTELGGIANTNCGTSYSLTVDGVGTGFKREATLSTGTDVVNVTVTVYWPNSNNPTEDHRVEIKQSIWRW